MHPGETEQQSVAPIFVNGRFLARAVTGVDRFGREVLVAMDDLLSQDQARAGARQWVVVVPPSATDLPPLKAMGYQQAGRGAGTMWEQWTLPRVVGRAPCLSLCNTAPAFSRCQAVVIHDASPVRIPHAYSWAFRAWYRLLIPWVGKRAAHVFTVSKFSRQEIAAAYGIPLPRIAALPRQGVEHMQRVVPDPAILHKARLLERPYVLAVSSRAPHKNFTTLVEAVRRIESPDFDVVVAGGTNPRVFAADGMPLADWVKYVGYVSDAELRALYENAACFVFPSLYEGYGMPPLEAMACGCPVLMAHAASMPEVYGDSAAYFDPRNADELARLMQQVLASPDAQADLRARGTALVARSTWRSIAQVILDAVMKRPSLALQQAR